MLRSAVRQRVIFLNPCCPLWANSIELGKIQRRPSGGDNFGTAAGQRSNSNRGRLRSGADQFGQFLSQPGAGVRACANADKALTQVIHFQSDLVLSDISMPGKDGFELLQEIRTLGRSSGGEAPVVVISGMTRPLDQARAPL
jgi:hypothetical protein